MYAEAPAHLLSAAAVLPHTDADGPAAGTRLPPGPVVVDSAVRGGPGDPRARLGEALSNAGGGYAPRHLRASGATLAPNDSERLLGELGDPA